jgi:hypothetical protein
MVVCATIVVEERLRGADVRINALEMRFIATPSVTTVRIP